MGTLICWWGQRLHIKVKGHLRSSCKIGWKCENGLIWKVEVRLEPNLVYWQSMGTFICSCGQRSYTKVKGHLRSSCKIGWKCENDLIWKVGSPIWTKLGDLDQMLTCIIHKPRRQASVAFWGPRSIFIPKSFYSRWPFFRLASRWKFIYQMVFNHQGWHCKVFHSRGSLSKVFFFIRKVIIPNVV